MDQCNTWLKAHSDVLHRNSEDINSNRPMTMVFNCNFERIFEQKERKITEDTITYFKFNKWLQSILVVTEISYCLLCMLLFLVIIYWNHKGEKKVIFG